MEPSERDLFDHFARARLNAQAFDADPNTERGYLFGSALETARALMGWTKGARNEAGEEFKAVSGFVDVYTPNAFAERFEKRFYLGMHTALFVAINEFAMFCFCQRDFFADIGDPSRETSPRPIDGHAPGLWLLKHTRSGGHVKPEHSEQLTPRCDTRYAASIYLAILMSRFVWLHELAHAFNGHASFAQERGLALRLTELPERLLALEIEDDEADAAHRKTMQTLELDADRSAFWASWRVQIDGLENVEGLAAMEESLRLRLVLFGCYAMTWLFEEFEGYMRSRHAGTQPPPSTRLFAIVQLAKERLSDTRSDFASLNADACAQFDGICQAIPTIFRPAAFMRAAADLEHRVGYETLVQDLEALRLQFNRYAFHTE